MGSAAAVSTLSTARRMIRLVMVAQIEVADFAAAKVDVVVPILFSRSQGYVLAGENLAHDERLPAHVDLPWANHLAHQIVRLVFYRWQAFWESARAGLIAVGGHAQPQRLMWALAIVDLAPVIKVRLTGRQVAQDLGLQHLLHQGAPPQRRRKCR